MLSSCALVSMMGAVILQETNISKPHLWYQLVADGVRLHERDVARLPKKGGWYPPTPTVLCISHLLHMKWNFNVLGSCWGTVWTHLEVQLLMMAHSVQKLYLKYQGYPGGGYHPLNSLTVFI